MNAMADALSSSLLRLRVLELALYGDHEWTMRAPDGRAAMATVEVLDDAVIFTAKMTGPLSETFLVVLEADGDARLVFPARIPCDALEGDAVTVKYRLTVENLVAA